MSLTPPERNVAIESASAEQLRSAYRSLLQSCESFRKQCTTSAEKLEPFIKGSPVACAGWMEKTRFAQGLQEAIEGADRHLTN